MSLRSLASFFHGSVNWCSENFAHYIYLLVRDKLMLNDSLALLMYRLKETINSSKIRPVDF